MPVLYPRVEDRHSDIFPCVACAFGFPGADDNTALMQMKHINRPQQSHAAHLRPFQKRRQSSHRNAGTKAATNCQPLSFLSSDPAHESG